MSQGIKVQTPEDLNLTSWLGERFVIHSPTRGVYLGNKIWTKDNTQVKYNEVPTFHKDEIMQKEFYDYVFTQVTDSVVYQCPPDRRGNYATRKQANNCFVPEDW